MATKATKPTPAFDVDAFLRTAGVAKAIVSYRPTDVIFSQGDAADSVLYIQKGAVTVSVFSRAGKEAVVAMLGPGDFFGERALARPTVRLETATARTATTLLVVPKAEMTRVLQEEHALRSVATASRATAAANIQYSVRHIADTLAKAGIEAAHAEGLQVVANCHFVKAYLRKHPQPS
jgi:CRP-like cAMP-binding protein